MVATGLLAQVPGDGLRTRIVASFGQLLAQRHDRVLDGAGGAPRARVRAAGARLERCLTLHLVAPDEDLHPLPRDPVVAGHLALRPTLDHHRHDHHTRHRHRRSPPPSGCKRCRETPANYVLNSDTWRRTNVVISASSFGRSSHARINAKISVVPRGRCVGAAARRWIARAPETYPLPIATPRPSFAITPCNRGEAFGVLLDEEARPDAAARLRAFICSVLLGHHGGVKIQKPAPFGNHGAGPRCGDAHLR